jgi:hypothetical protein
MMLMVHRSNRRRLQIVELVKLVKSTPRWLALVYFYALRGPSTPYRPPVATTTSTDLPAINPSDQDSGKPFKAPTARKLRGTYPGHPKTLHSSNWS